MMVVIVTASTSPIINIQSVFAIPTSSITTSSVCLLEIITSCTSLIKLS